MAIHSSILAPRVPWIEEPGGLQSIGLQTRTGLKQLSTHACNSSQSTFMCSTLMGQHITQLVLVLQIGKVSTLSMLNGQLINGRARNHPSFPTSDTELFPGLIYHWVGEKNE